VSFEEGAVRSVKVPMPKDKDEESRNPKEESVGIDREVLDVNEDKSGKRAGAAREVPVPREIKRNLLRMACFWAHRAPSLLVLSSLAATLMGLLASVANKRLTTRINSLDATLTKNTGEGPGYG
jgi:hypothetical protein